MKLESRWKFYLKTQVDAINSYNNTAMFSADLNTLIKFDYLTKWFLKPPKSQDPKNNLWFEHLAWQ